ncbi:putative glutamine amidotransferase-like protein C13C5.04 [Candida viswanathii]|uniref:Putative glutamine amidotransferase-like protein C13C5.04 n=1 Tax=Candida viswanathii TaxID=5486 RepID=A0A367YLQ9_9ASCO|nr:putative glutamine amidotransferase-like protein C13C5.04 [Candida viswanathii]
MTSTVPKHIAVLVLDTPIPNVAEKYGDFGDNTIDLLSRANNKAPAVKYQLCGEDEAALDGVYLQLHAAIAQDLISGFILTGSRSNAFDETPWIQKLEEFIVLTLYKLPVPIVGICFGHQILAKGLGCKIGRNELGWEIGIHTIELNQEIFKLDHNPFVSNLLLATTNTEEDKSQKKQIILDHLNLVEFHQDIIYGLPSKGYEMVSIGSTVKCGIQGMISKETCPIKLLTFQGHPEFTTDIALDMLKSKFENGLITEAEYEKYKYQTTSLNNQGDLIGRVILNFLST